MVQCLIKNRITFLGMEGWNYTHIKIKGFGISIVELDRPQARDLIKSENLQLIDTSQYDYHLGKIYTDGKFKDFVNKHKKLKKYLLYLLEKLD